MDLALNDVARRHHLAEKLMRHKRPTRVAHYVNISEVGPAANTSCGSGDEIFKEKAIADLLGPVTGVLRPANGINFSNFISQQSSSALKKGCCPSLRLDERDLISGISDNDVKVASLVRDVEHAANFGPNRLPRSERRGRSQYLR